MIFWMIKLMRLKFVSTCRREILSKNFPFSMKKGKLKKILLARCEMRDLASLPFSPRSLCHRINFTRHKLYNFLEFSSVFKDLRQDWTLDFIIDLFSCRCLNEVYNDILMIVNRFTKYAIYILARKNWKVEDFANALTNNVFKNFDMFASIVNDKESLFISHF